MLRWYVASLVFLLVISPGIGYAVYRYVLTHPAEPGTLSGRVYEWTVKKKLSHLCNDQMKHYVQSGDANTESQSEAACTCFTDQMFEKFRLVPPGDLDALAEQEATQRMAGAVFENCANRSGLN
ncbi:MAG TPA: hypothetical protein VFE34_21110 [Dongiaceae bacterium]|jgi:hypothetical protein|nr:hypothetical protein [Dongiaceae bacterium]